MKYIQKSYCYARRLAWGMALVALAFYSSCDRPDDTPKPNYELKCPDAFEIDCTDMDTIGSYTSKNWVNKVTYTAPAFLSNSNEEIIYVETNHEDILAGERIVRYNWKTKERKVLLKNLSAVWTLHTASNGRVCMRLINGTISHFHIDSAEATLKLVPFYDGSASEPAFLADGETIIFVVSPSFELTNKIRSYNIRTEEFNTWKLPVDSANLSGIHTGNVNTSDDFVIRVKKDGYYKVNFHDLNTKTLVGEFQNMALTQTSKLGNTNGLYYGGFEVHHIADNQDWLIRPLCRQHLIEHMDISDDDNFLVYTVDVPVDHRKHSFLTCRQELRIIDIANCEEYNISPFD